MKVIKPKRLIKNTVFNNKKIFNSLIKKYRKKLKTKKIVLIKGFKLDKKLITKATKVNPILPSIITSL